MDGMMERDTDRKDATRIDILDQMERMIYKAE
jgi:hypothetical protein